MVSVDFFSLPHLYFIKQKAKVYQILFILKELARLIEDSERRRGNVIDADIIQEWMTRNRVLSLALEGRLKLSHGVQQEDRSFDCIRV